MKTIHDVVIAGGGVIGLSIAWELISKGYSVLVVDRGNPQEAASWAAAGMLAPMSETDSPSPFFDLCLESVRRYRPWAERLHAASGIDPEYSDPGLLFVASNEHELCRLKRAAEWQKAAGLSVDLLTPEETARLEPLVTLPIIGAAWMPDEHCVTPRRLLESLRGACAAKGVEIRGGAPLVEVIASGGRVTGVRTASWSADTGHVVIASGVWSGGIAGLCPSIPVAPRKGQILSLRSQGPGFRRMLRSEHVYLVPRRNGELIVGATNEDAGFDRSLTPAGVGTLLHRAMELSSQLGRFPIDQMWTGLRPATPDGFPVIGNADVDGLIYATGHYRNGILLAPATAAAVSSLVAGQAPPVALAAFSPSRFAV